MLFLWTGLDIIRKPSHPGMKNKIIYENDSEMGTEPYIVSGERCRTNQVRSHMYKTHIMTVKSKLVAANMIKNNGDGNGNADDKIDR
jgi:hypothetical protein